MSEFHRCDGCGDDITGNPKAMGFNSLSTSGKWKNKDRRFDLCTLCATKLAQFLEQLKAGPAGAVPVTPVAYRPTSWFSRLMNKEQENKGD